MLATLTGTAWRRRKKGSADNPVQVEPYGPQLPCWTARSEAANTNEPPAEVAADARHMQSNLNLPSHSEPRSHRKRDDGSYYYNFHASLRAFL
jgi:hypothetical protein